MKLRKRRRFISSIVVSVLCWCAYPAYWLMSEIDERQHRAEEWEVSPPTPPTKPCPYCLHGTPLHGDYCTHCGKYVNVPMLALAAPSCTAPVLHMPKTPSSVLRALTAAGSPRYDPSHSNPRLFAASVLFPSDTATVPSVRVSGNLYHERDTPQPGTWRYDDEVSNG